MLIPYRDFPVRPTRLAGESLVSYVYRFYYENGHEVPLSLRQALRDFYFGNKPDAAFQIILQLLGLGLGQRRAGWLTGYQELDLTLLTGYKPTGKRTPFSPIRYCPNCLEELGFFAEFWMLPQVEACPYHHCLLLSRCSSCNRSVSWSNTRPGWICRCGAKFAVGQRLAAAAWQITLATMIVQATDVEAPYSEEGSFTLPRLLSVDQYSLQDVYGLLRAVKAFHRELTRRKSYFTYETWPYNVQPARRNEPDGWIMRFATANQATREKRFRRALTRWNFCPDNTLLVHQHVLGPVALMITAMGPFQSNPLVCSFILDAEIQLREYHVDIHYLDNVYFHPGVLTPQRTAYLSELARWWHGLAKQLAVLEPEYQFDTTHSLSITKSGSDSIFDLLNSLLSAARTDRQFESYFKLVKRWHIPAVLQRKVDADRILDVLAEYLSSLTYAERLFFHDLIKDADRVSGID
ncbi:TniQ family protein [Methylomonas sp. TEB]|uniref:TniQ family protein n=1 Tax=Methylomonas sp. TEB TaxID=3398229 RepID=UPI0039F62AEF